MNEGNGKKNPRKFQNKVLSELFSVQEKENYQKYQFYYLFYELQDLVSKLSLSNVSEICCDWVVGRRVGGVWSVRL